MGELTWWSNKTLRLTDAESHAAVQNLRQEVREGVRDCGQATEAHGETPDLEIKARLQELDEVERLGGDIISIGVDASDDKVHFTLVEETPGLLWVCVGEGNQETVTHETNADGEDAFDDEDPAGNLYQYRGSKRNEIAEILELTAILPSRLGRSSASDRMPGYH